MGFARASFVLLAALALGAPRLASASPVTLHFSGNINDLFVIESFTPPFVPSGYNGSFGVGSPFSGSVTLDDSMSDSNPDVTIGSYASSTLPFSATLQFGTYTLTSGSIITAFVEDDGSDLFSVSADYASVSGAPGFTFDWAGFGVFLDGGGPLDSDALASVPFTLGSWSNASVHFGVRRFGDLAWGFSGGGQMTSLSAVPEPSALLLLSLSVIALANRR